MKHTISIRLSRDTGPGGIVNCKTVTCREKLLHKLLGSTQKVMILIPGSSVSTVTITELAEGGVVHG